MRHTAASFASASRCLGRRVELGPMGGGASTLSAEEIAPTLAKSPLAVDIEADILVEVGAY